jgi:hypothetical protein
MILVQCYFFAYRLSDIDAILQHLRILNKNNFKLERIQFLSCFILDRLDLILTFVAKKKHSQIIIQNRTEQEKKRSHFHFDSCVPMLFKQKNKQSII